MKIDVEEINFILFRLGDPPKYYKKNGIKFKSGISIGILMFIRGFLHSLFLFPLKYARVNANYKGVVFLYETINQRNALNPIIQKYQSTNPLILFPETLPLWRTYVYALPFLFQLFELYLSSSIDRKKVIRAYFSRFWQSYGTYIFFYKIVQYYQPRVLIMANDHNVWQKCLIQIANEKGIETIYVQHASVSELFPPLRFSYACLDGLESWDKYKKTGVNTGNIYLTGGVRFDAVPKLCAHKIIESRYNFIGIAANALDSKEKIKELCLALHNRVNEIKIVFRPHPEILNDIDLIRWCLSKGLSISYPNKESAYEFLSRIDLLISNESAIHLDALICHTNTILFNMSDDPFRDYYGYVHKDLVRHMESIDDVIKCIHNKYKHMVSSNLIEYYHAAYRTKYEGEVAMIIVKLIDSILVDSASSFSELYGFKLLENNDNYQVYTYHSNSM